MARPFSRLFLLATFLVGWSLALARLGERSLWADEGYSALLARDAPAIGMLKMLQMDPNQGALHMLLVTGAMRLGGSEFILRFPSAMAALLTLALLYLLGRHWMSREAALAAAFLHAISPYIVGYAQEARPYALLEMLACLSLLLLWQAMVHNRWFWWAGLSVTLGLLLYTHHFAWFILAAELLFCALVLLRSSWVGRRLDRRAGPSALSFLAGVGLYLPWLPVLLAFWRQAGPGGSPVQAAGLPLFRLSLKFFRDMLAVFGSRSYGWQVYLFAGAILAGLVALAFRKKWQTLLLAGSWFALPLAGLSALTASHFFDFRYVIFFLPLLLLLAAEGLATCARGVSRRLPGAGGAPLAPVIAGCLALLLFLPANYAGLRAHFRWEKENWRGISTFIAENLLPGEAVYVSPRYWANPMLYYQPSLRQPLVGGSAEDLDPLVTAAEGRPGLWFLRYAGRLGDPTGQIGVWLKERGYVLLVDGRGCGSGIHVYYGGTGEGVAARQAELRQTAAALCPEDTGHSP